MYFDVLCGNLASLRMFKLIENKYQNIFNLVS